jgi:DNA phosphorothioation-dependent restriction protein DptG
MTIKTEQNGTSSKAATTSTKPEHSIVQVSQKSDEKIQEKPNLTFNQRSEKVKNLFSLLDKHEKLSETRDNLNNFKLSADGHTGKLSMADNHGSNFSTSNPSVIADVLALIKKVVDNQIKDLEEQINF